MNLNDVWRLRFVNVFPLLMTTLEINTLLSGWPLSFCKRERDPYQFKTVTINMAPRLNYHLIYFRESLNRTFATTNGLSEYIYQTNRVPYVKVCFSFFNWSNNLMKQETSLYIICNLPLYCWPFLTCLLTSWTCKRIFTRSMGATAVFDTAADIPPARKSFKNPGPAPVRSFFTTFLSPI